MTDGLRRVYLEAALAEPEVHAFVKGQVCLFTGPAPEDGRINEDSAALVQITPEVGVLVVADGAGGRPAGREASRLVVEAVVQAALKVDPAENGAVRGAILNSIEEANQAILAKGNGACATVAVVELQGSTARTYHVGDSMVLVTGQRGKIKLQTVAHSPTGYAVESGLIDEDEAVHHEERHLVLNLVGTPEMRIEIGPVVQLARRDTLLIASDGLYDNLYMSEIIDHVRMGAIGRSCSDLVSAARKRMLEPKKGEPSHSDDVSLVTIRPSPPSSRKRTRKRKSAAAAAAASSDKHKQSKSGL